MCASNELWCKMRIVIFIFKEQKKLSSIILEYREEIYLAIIIFLIKKFIKEIEKFWTAIIIFLIKKFIKKKLKKMNSNNYFFN